MNGATRGASGRPKTPALFGERGLDTGGELVALRPTEHGREVAHHFGIGIELRERDEVVLTPLSE